MLGFSIGEWMVTVGVGVAAFGPKDIPVIARGLGKLTGQAVGAKNTQPSPKSFSPFVQLLVVF